ncbi:hypothetical protein Ccar_22560 [Clostridium carboxidivorans P7]|uniref:Uncharacterized protein n=1 Tax=Clostridium carboxidivorans P7 TaxID=536227 RepID=C6PXS6_9CLOT|nr:hypothetical protein [Clostridium carboxidivorans]AKN33456.1 hypothetical protein Ccar_22560 [Clostridium carboxidivorans P7]EET85957.1 hypothetical protein CcarbDRAFT_3593 [Clostridium carboxidivorans P7]EFG89160.1 hypothetical protein CLCAR_1035 [Clostridium carboxidivorans P7]
MSKRKCFALMSSLAMSLIISAATFTNVHAAVKSYIASDASGRIISFNLDDLLADYTNSLIEQPSPMFDEYKKDSSNLIAFEDSIKGYVSYDFVMDAYANALVAGTPFNMDAVTENATSSDIKNVLVGYKWENGSIVPTVKATVEKAGTDIAGKTAVVASLPANVDATKYKLTIDGQTLTYDASTNKFTVTLDGTFTIQDLQSKIMINSNDESSSDSFGLDNVY